MKTLTRTEPRYPVGIAVLMNGQRARIIDRVAIEKEDQDANRA